MYVYACFKRLKITIFLVSEVQLYTVIYTTNSEVPTQGQTNALYNKNKQKVVEIA